MDENNVRLHKILKNACLVNSSGDESEEDIIENTPQSSPKHSIKSTRRVIPVLELGEKSIEAPPYSPLTPRPITLSDERNGIPMARSALEIGEKSIEAPPYSPLTPTPLVLIGEKSIYNQQPQLLTRSPLSSPLPCMSPATRKVFRMMIDEEFHDSDDSVKDPNYNLEHNYCTSDEDSSDTDTRDTADINRRKNNDTTNYQDDNNSISLILSGNRESLNHGDNYDVECTPSILDRGNDNASFSLIGSENYHERTERDNVPIPSIQNDDDTTISLPSQNSNEQNDMPQENNNALEGSLPKKRKVRNPSQWKVNIEKQKRLQGGSYKTKKGKTKPARPLKPAACSENHKCKAVVPEEERIKIFKIFRNMNSLQEQRQFIVNHVTKKKKNRQTTNGPSRRNFTQVYKLTVSSEQKVVCRQFFLDTLNISGAFVKGSLKKLNQEGILLPDNRGKRSPSNKLSVADENYIRDHILSFPAVESHYCRRDSEVKYLDTALNITILYQEYKKQCESARKKPACFEKYRQIFRQYKLNFHKPKKDLCKQCLAYKEMSEDEKTSNAEAHSKHLSRRDAARICRNEDKEEAKNDISILSFNFDLEAVLSTPKGAAGPFFYVRKLAVYNLTMYNLGNQDVECFMWDETEGKRGTVEISTCVNRYIMEKEGIKKVKMMSDGCGGQQKNYHFCSMCLLTVQQHPTLEIIDHKFFETGHTHMECDSIHSKIERKAKNIPVYTPDGWAQVVRMARNKPRPFKVMRIMHDEFKDFGSKQQFQALVNKGNKIGLNNAVWLQYRKEAPDTIFLKTTFDKDEPFVTFKLKKRRAKTVINYPLTVYSQRLMISQKKKQDLLKLCADLQIPRNYHEYYNALPCSENVSDTLPEPDIAEESE